MLGRRSLMLSVVMFGAGAAFAHAETTTITSNVDDNVTVQLAGSVAAPVAFATDKGSLPSSHAFSHILLGMKRPAASQSALDQLVADQQDRNATRYHHWLHAADLRQFGPAQPDIDKVTEWLRSQGFSINAVSPSGMTIDFSGDVAAVSKAFHTGIHAFQLKGESHVANITPLSIPAALAPAVDGVTISNFFPQPQFVPKSNFTIPTGDGNLSFYAVAPGDFYTIYNLDPIYSGSAGLPKAIDGTGVTIAVVEQTNILASDWNRFRSAFGVGVVAGTFSQIHPGGCANPGRTPDETEAALDAEWAGATAYNAYIVNASCAATEMTFGVMTSLQNLIEKMDTDASIYSISYGGCEQEDGIAFLDMWSSLAEEGAAKGISIVVSSGDSGASCDRGVIAQDGLGVNGLASNPYVTSVGGTDFLDTARGQTSSYWSARNFYGVHSALSYIPEIPWDNSCANSIIAAYAGAASGSAYCNSGDTSGVQDGVGGSGGASLLYQKPSWQFLSLKGMPNDGARDQPDVSFFAANGYWDHAYLICMSDANEGGSPCNYKGTNAFAQAVGGTSVAAPAFAGMLGLETELTGARLGNVNPRLYELAALQFSNPILVESCKAGRGRQISKACVFNNVTDGDNAEPCFSGTPDCNVAKKSDEIGVLSVRNGDAGTPAYQAHAGYSTATGLGSINGTNLLTNY